jgi:hypothetical protein
MLEFGEIHKIALSTIILKSALDGELRRVEPSLICFGATKHNDALVVELNHLGGDDLKFTVLALLCSCCFAQSSIPLNGTN